MPSQVPAACGVRRRHEPPSQNSSWWLQISESPRFKISVDHPGQSRATKMTGSSWSEHDTKLTLRAESSACVSGDANNKCMSRYCRHGKSKFKVQVYGLVQNMALLPLCHQPLTVRDPAMSPRRQSRYLGPDKGCQRYRCHSIGSPLSALESRPRSRVPSTFGAPLLNNPPVRRPPGEGLPISAGRYFGDQKDERVLHVEDGNVVARHNFCAPRLTGRGRS